MLKLSCRWMAIALALLLVNSTLAFAESDEDDFLPPDEAFSHEVEKTDDGKIKLKWSVEPDYYMYKSRLEIEGEPEDPESVDYPDGEQIEDEYFGKQEVYKKDYSVEIDPGDADKLKLTWQGCAEAGLCYPPQHDEIDLSDE